jgi:hypothetical protein
MVSPLLKSYCLVSLSRPSRPFALFVTIPSRFLVPSQSASSRRHGVRLFEDRVQTRCGRGLSSDPQIQARSLALSSFGLETMFPLILRRVPLRRQRLVERVPRGCCKCDVFQVVMNTITAALRRELSTQYRVK